MKTIVIAILVLGLGVFSTQQSAAQESFDWVQSDIDLYNLEVIKVDGRRLTVRIAELQARRTFRVPTGFEFYIDSKPTDVSKLQPRQKLVAYVTRSGGGELVLVDAGPPKTTPPVAPPKPPVIAPQAPAPVMAALPKTASLLPLVGLGGLLMLATAFGLRRMRARG